MTPLTPSHSPSNLLVTANRIYARMTTSLPHLCHSSPSLLWSAGVGSRLAPCIHSCALQSVPHTHFKNINQVISFFCLPLSNDFPVHWSKSEGLTMASNVHVIWFLWPHLPRSLPLSLSSSHPPVPPSCQAHFHLCPFVGYVLPLDLHVVFSLIPYVSFKCYLLS